MRDNPVAPIHTSGVAVRHVGPRGATWVPLSIPTWSLSNLPSPKRLPSADHPRGYAAGAWLSCHSVPCRSIAHITRTR
jgi:hypothetical protein